MFLRNALSPCIGLLVLALLFACRTQTRLQSTELLAYFQSQPISDTLHIEYSDEPDRIRDTIPNRLFFKIIPATLLQQIDYLADSSAAIVLGRKIFPLDGNISACWVEIRESWFQHHSLFLYDRSKQRFTDRITVGEFFGGDGGQILVGSWVFDYDGDGKKDIVRQEIQHSMTLNADGDEPIEHLEAATTLLLWKNGRFVDTPFQDSAAMIRRFPIQSFW